MGWDVKREGRALQRIIALLLALAHVADRAASLPIPARMIVLAVLRHAETVAWAFAFGTKPPPTADMDVSSLAEAARLTRSLRALALIVAHWAMRAVLPPVPRAVFGSRLPARALGSWRMAETIAAPDTS